MKKLFFLLSAVIFLLCSCSGNIDTGDNTQKSVLDQLEADIIELSKKPRPIGSDGEKNAVIHIKERFENLGYSVSLSPYSIDGEILGNNVIAIRDSELKGDILVISTHHDSFPTSFGSNDNASGVAALLAVANALKDISTDTELRFISFTDEENGKNGSRQYIEALSEEEKERMVGCIQLDMLGGLGSNGNTVCTTDGSPNWLSELLLKNDSSLTSGIENASDHASFQIAGIPSVIITQKGQGYLYHTAGDTPSALNTSNIYDASAAVIKAVNEIASADTPSYAAIAKEQADGYFYSQKRNSKILFSASKADNEAILGFSGKLIDSREEVGDGWSDLYETYEYSMGWFGGKERMTTHYIYRNGYLENVEIHPSENGYTTEQIYGLISDMLSDPHVSDEDNKSWSWEDELYGKYISLKETDGAPVVYVYSYSLGISNNLATYEIKDGETQIDEPGHRKIWDLFCSVIPKKHRNKIAEFNLFTDGYSNMLAYTSTMGDPENADNTKFSITIDYYDAFDENGNARDNGKLIYTLVHEYGHVLLEDETQIDISNGGNIHDPECFVEGAFRSDYYNEFWKDPYESYLGSYWDKPENYVSGYAGNAFHEDIADTFAVFVFGDKPSGNSVAEKKLLFFWNDSDMTALRSEIRAELGLDK